MKILEREVNNLATRDGYKKVAWFYNFWSWLTESKAADMVIDLAQIRDNTAVLEIACGTGIVFEKIVKKNPNGRNCGIDISPDMLNKARARLNKIKNAHFELGEGDVLNLQYQPASFDLIINNFMLDLMPENTFEKCAQTFFDLLKPGGKVVLSTFSFGQKKINHFWYWLAVHYPKMLTGCRPISFEAYLKQVGFQIESINQISQNTFPAEIIKARKTI